MVFKSKVKIYRLGGFVVSRQEKSFFLFIWLIFRWVSIEQSGEMQYRVVSPLLTSSGDYTPVYALIATSKVSYEVMVLWKLTYWVFDLIKYQIVLNYNPVYALLITLSKVSFEIMVLWKLNYLVSYRMKYQIILNYNPCIRPHFYKQRKFRKNCAMETG